MDPLCSRIGIREVMVLAVILCLSVLARNWKLDFGLPWRAYTDECHYVNIGLGLLKDFDLNPHYFQNPPGWTYALLPGFAAYYACGRFSGAVASPAEFRAQVHADPTGLFAVARLESVVCSLTTVVLVWAAARRCGSALAGVFAASAMAFGFLGVRESHFAVNDTALTTLFAAVLLLATSPVTRHLLYRRFLLLGALVGSATAVKYNAVLLLPAAVVAVFSGSRDTKSWQRFAALSCVAIGVLLGFTAICPWWILNSATFFRDVAEQAALSHQRWSEQPPLHTYQLAWLTLCTQFGLPSLAFAALGMVVLIRQTPRSAVVIAALLLAYAVAVLSSRLFFARFLLPVTPVVALLIGTGVAASISALYKKRASPFLTRFVALILVLGPPLLSTLQGMRVLATVDTRDDAWRWVQTYVSGRARVLDVGSELPLERALDVPRDRIECGNMVVQRRNSRDTTGGNWQEILDEILAVDYVVVTDTVWARRNDRGEIDPQAARLMAFLSQHATLACEFSPYAKGSRFDGGLFEAGIPYYEIAQRVRMGSHLKIFRMAARSTAPAHIDSESERAPSGAPDRSGTYGVP